MTRADTVFKGVVTDKTFLWVGSEEARHIAMRMTFRVDETYKGAAAQQTPECVGGTVGDTTLQILGLPKFALGQSAVKDQVAGSERLFTDDGLLVANTADLGRFDEAGVSRLKRTADAGATGMTADDFKSAILCKVATLTK